MIINDKKVNSSIKTDNISIFTVNVRQAHAIILEVNRTNRLCRNRNKLHMYAYPNPIDKSKKEQVNIRMRIRIQFA